MSPVSWGDIFTLLFRGDKIMELRHRVRTLFFITRKSSSIGSPAHDHRSSPVVHPSAGLRHGSHQIQIAIPYRIGAGDGTASSPTEHAHRTGKESRSRK